MKKFNFDISKSVLIYHSTDKDEDFKAWPLKKTKCDILFYEDKKCTDLDYILCSTIHRSGGSVPKNELALILGFNIKDDFSCTPKRYKDKAELEIFDSLLKETLNDELIALEGENLILTSLGEFSLKHSCKRYFYSGTCDFIENFKLKVEEGEIFPFRKELSIESQIRYRSRLKYYQEVASNYDIEPNSEHGETYLVKALSYQVDPDSVIFDARLKEKEFSIEGHKVNLSLYKQGQEEYIVVYSTESDVSLYATQVLNDAKNENIKSQKVEWGYYLSILNNPQAKLDYATLFPFEDLIDWHELIKDSRFDWHDNQLFELLKKNQDANLWHEISEHCPLSEIKRYLNPHSRDFWDWTVLSAKFDGDYIVENSTLYSWDFDIVLNNKNVSDENIQLLIQDQRLLSVQWQWHDVMPRLSKEFVISNIDKIPFSLKEFTRQHRDDVKELLLRFPDKQWDWAYITNNYELDYIFENISLLAKRIELNSLIIRSLSSDEYCHTFCSCREVKDELVNAIEKHDLRFNANSLNLKWNYETIDFLENLGLLTWDTAIIDGFEFNQNITWDSPFFSRYSSKIHSPKGIDCLTRRITESSIIDSNPNFPWNWEIIDFRSDFLKEPKFVKNNLEKLSNGIALSNFSEESFNVAFEDNRFRQFLLAYPSNLTKATELASIDLVRNNIDYDWDWEVLTHKTIDSIKPDRLGDSQWIDKWDWSYLSQNLPTEQIIDFISDYIEYWDWSVLTKRLGGKYILENLAEYSEYWDWKVVINNVCTNDDLLPKSFLPTIATCIDTFEEDIQKELWTDITQKFPIEELYTLVYETSESQYSFIFKWDLEFFYNHVNFNINYYLEEFRDIIDWSLLSKSDSAKRLFFFDKDILSYEVWFKTIKGILEDEKYCWDFKALSQNESINWNFSFLRIHTSLWDWLYLSEHSKCFSDHAGKRKVPNILMFKNLLDFDILSARNDLTFDEVFFNQLSKIPWNWYALSSSPKLSISKEYLIKTKDRTWNWEAFSKSTNFTVDLDLISQTQDKNWNFHDLSSNPKLKVSLSDIMSVKKADWDLIALSSREDISFDNDSFILSIQNHFIWDWKAISHRNDLIFDETLIEEVYSQPLDWAAVSQKATFTPTLRVLSLLSDKELDWDSISQNATLTNDVLWLYKDQLNWTLLCNTERFIEIGLTFFEKYKAYIDWSQISASASFIPNIDNLSKFKDVLDWGKINKREDFIYTNLIVEKFYDYIDWDKASMSHTIDFSVPFIKKYVEKWNWELLFNNPLIIEKSEVYEEAFKDRVNQLKFINRFYTNEPKIYHFAHLFNALNIIRSRKILSRLKAQGLFENSAGSNVYRRDTAHHYARFYFRPQTPTQFYNECLGKDSHSGYTKTWHYFNGYETVYESKWVDYYPQACNLGLPKCPMPVFLEFDLQEVLDTNLHKCFYSNGNMQKDSSRVMEVSTEPERLNTDFVYSTIQDGLDTYKNYSQQEFLIKDEFDFSNIKNMRIICYDEEQAKILKEQLGDDPICSVITTDTYTSSSIDIYNRKNRSLEIEEHDDILNISTDYLDPCFIELTSEQLDRINLVSTDDVKHVSKNKISAYPSISFHKTDVPLIVRFVDKSKYNASSWIIYSNVGVHDSNQLNFEFITDELINSFKEETGNLNICLSKSLFYQHMLNSYHGIAHTSRVMWNGFVISFFDKSMSISDRATVLYACLIHDLGKENDMQGEIHGRKSAELYTKAIQSIYGKTSEANNILSAVEYHSVDDSKCPANIRQNKIWQVLKDADALDRSRFHGKGCNPSFLRNSIFANKIGKEILALSQVLPSLTEGLPWDNPIDEIFTILKTLK